jgi:hypothetical protein
MWCKHCQQDVPGIVCAESGQYRCPRCAEGIHSPLNVTWVDQAGTQVADEQPGAPDGAGEDPPQLYDDWDFEDRLGHIGRVLAIDRPEANTSLPAGSSQTGRVDGSHPGTAGPHRAPSRKPATQRTDDPGPPEAAHPVLAFFTWAALSLGLMAFVCGGTLLGWSMIAGRQDLWTIGLPITLAGQIGLLAGLVLQLDRLWCAHRSTAGKLNHFDEELHELKRTATILGAAQSPPGSSFYAHLAGGAGPHLLLADLKGQLDLLAAKISQQGR